MKINIDLKKYNVFFENKIPLAIEIKASRQIAELLKTHKTFEEIPEEETVNVMYLDKIDNEFFLNNSNVFERKVNTLNRPDFIETQS